MMNIMIQTAILVIAILAVRKLSGKRLHAYIRYGLWMSVVLRLLIPVNFVNSPISVLRIGNALTAQYEESIGIAEELSADSKMTEMGSIDVTIPDSQLSDSNDSEDDSAPGKGQETVSTGNVYLSEEFGGFDTIESNPEEGRNDSSGLNRSPIFPADKRNISVLTGKMKEAFRKNRSAILEVLCGIWMTGSVLVGGFLAIVHFRFRRRLYRVRRLCQNAGRDITGIDILKTDTGKKAIPVYCVDNLESPCLFGIIHPAIYIGPDIQIGSDYFRYIVTHERVHYLHGDHIWALLRSVLVTVYWFHPFVWIAAAASARDGEIACDHGTVRRLGEEERMNYGTMLLDLVRAGNANRKKIYSYGVGILAKTK